MPSRAGANKKTCLLIAGMQRTGTNFVQELVNRNMRQCRVDWSMIWWKHDVNPITDEAMQQHSVRGVILVIKNPYTWAESICHRKAADIGSVKHNRAYEIRAPGHTVNGINLRSIMRLYKDFYTNWLTVEPMIFVKYEHVLEDQGRHRLFEQIRDEFGIDETVGHIRVPRKVPWTLASEMGSLKNYRNEHAPLLTAEDRALINKTLRGDFFQRICYTRIRT